MINNEQLCSNGSIYHVILVVSSIPNFMRRKALRDTWTQNDYLQSQPSRAIFVLGNTYNKDQQILLQEEDKLYHDIVQVNFRDTYHNVTFKVLVGIKWIISFCS